MALLYACKRPVVFTYYAQLFFLTVHHNLASSLFYSSGGNLHGPNRDHTYAPLLRLLCQTQHHSSLPAMDLLYLLYQVPQPDI